MIEASDESEEEDNLPYTRMNAEVPDPHLRIKD